LSWLFFKRVVQSNVGEALGLQKLKNRIQDKSAVKMIDSALTISLVGITFIFAFEFDYMHQIYLDIIRGACVGLAAGFFGAIRPEHIKK
jgi:hypothetical protein